MSLVMRVDLNSLARKAQKEALERYGNEALRRSQAIVPYLSGALSASASLEVSGGRAEIRYTAPYAAVQHENESFFHPNHRQSKYLKSAAEASLPELLNFQLKD